MKARAHNLRPVETAELFEYPIGIEDRLDGHYFLTWRFHDWMTSDFRLLSDLEVRAVGFDLFNVAQTQSPVGTLPDDHRILSRLVGLTLDKWNDLCAREVSPLYKWEPCLCAGGVVRLYHPRVLQTVKAALGLRDDKLQKREDERARKRMEALPDQIIRAGGSSAMAKDGDLLIRLDAFLMEHFPSRQRRPAFLRTALEGFELARDGRDWRAATGL